MLHRVNKTPFAVELLPALDKDGAEYLVVAIKATFSVSPARGVQIAEEQVPVTLADVHRGEPGQSSVLHESDGALRKPGVDVVLNGTAYGPSSGVSTMDVELRVGGARKVVRVFGPRVWARSSPTSCRPSLPGRITAVPLIWELAFGGIDASHADPARRASEPRNPVGVGFFATGTARDATPRDTEGLPLPQLEDPTQLLQQLGDCPPPAGFGFVARSWSPRVALAGTYDEAWRADRAPLLPLDFDDHHYLGAPGGLGTPGGRPLRELVGGELISASGVVRGSGPFELTLPRRTIEVSIESGATVAPHRARLDTVILEPDASRVLLTYRASVPVRRRLLDIDRVRVREVAA